MYPNKKSNNLANSILMENKFYNIPSRSKFEKPKFKS